MAVIFLSGVDCSNHSTSFLIWHEFLHAQGKDVDVTSWEPQTHPDSPDAADSSYKAQHIRPCYGDLLVVGPEALRESWVPEGWVSLFATHSRVFPMWTLKTLLKAWLAKRLSIDQQRRAGWLVNANIWEQPNYTLYKAVKTWH